MCIEPYYERADLTIYHGDCRDVLPQLPAESAHCVITSPPYWGLRDYGLPASVWGGDDECEHKWGSVTTPARKRTAPSNAVHKEGYKDAFRNSEYYIDHIADETPASGQFCRLCSAWRGCIGLEPTPELYVQHLVEVFREVKRVLRDDGTVWLNLGDSYSGGGGYSPGSPSNVNRVPGTYDGTFSVPSDEARKARKGVGIIPNGLKPKDLIGVPWRVAFALQADGWWLRSAIVWAKGLSFCDTYSGSVMPESVRDRPTSAYEMVFLLSKSARYYYDGDEVRERHAEPWRSTGKADRTIKGDGDRYTSSAGTKEGGLGDYIRTHGVNYNPAGRNLRNVWAINPAGFPGAHFATFPPALVEPCIKAGTSERGVCPECGAPGERVVRKEYVGDGITWDE